MRDGWCGCDNDLWVHDGVRFGHSRHDKTSWVRRTVGADWRTQKLGGSRNERGGNGISAENRRVASTATMLDSQLLCILDMHMEVYLLCSDVGLIGYGR